MPAWPERVSGVEKVGLGRNHRREGYPGLGMSWVKDAHDCDERFLAALLGTLRRHDAVYPPRRLASAGAAGRKACTSPEVLDARREDDAARAI